MIQMLRKEAVSGSIDDLAHNETNSMLADCLTKASAKPDHLIKCVETGLIPNVDSHPEFRSLLKHKAYLVNWMAHTLHDVPNAISFFDTPVVDLVHCFYVTPVTFSSFLSQTSSDVVSSSEPSPPSLQHHPHRCASCGRNFRHKHASASFEHQHDDHFLCCYTDCEEYFGRSDAHANNDSQCFIAN